MFRLCVKLYAYTFGSISAAGRRIVYNELYRLCDEIG